MATDNEKQLLAEEENAGREVEINQQSRADSQPTRLDGAETQMPESSNSEIQCVDTAASEGALEVASTEASATIVSSNLSTEKGADELNAQTTVRQSAQKEGDLAARRGPTGPRTALGKKRSSQNAIKFGVFSRASLLKGESRLEYQRLLEGLWTNLQPVGKLEEILVEKLASISWRYWRLLIAEGAEIRKSSDFLETDRRERVRAEAETISQKWQPVTGVKFSLAPVGLIWDIQNPDVLERCKELLVELRQKIEANGLIGSWNDSILRTIYGDFRNPHLRPTLYDRYSIWLRTAVVDESERQSKGYATPEQCKQAMLREIDAESARLKNYQKKRKLIESEQTKLDILRQGVPNSQELDRLLRYESSLERAFDRTLTQLERLQRMRKGQPVLPPIQLNVTA